MLALRAFYFLLPGIYSKDENLVSSGISLLRTYGTLVLIGIFGY
jgi:hypothetical protein